MAERLPVEDCFDQLFDAVSSKKPVILQAPPGAGKTTGVPPKMLEWIAGRGEILLLQPRRIAARAAAHRLSQLAHEPTGGVFGYRVRFDRKVGSNTRVTSMTTGILLQRLKSDPFLENVDCVILDEFHERSVEIDLALGMLERIRQTVRPELQLVVMSATLDTQPVAKLMPDAVTIQSMGRAFDVEIHYAKNDPLERYSSDGLADRILRQLSPALARTDGDVLVFLPGVGEIHRTADKIKALADQFNASVFKLFGDLSPQDQDQVLAPANDRKIVLATNVAETSVTIPGITCVIDSGLARVMQYDSTVGVPCLQLQPISKASADQRAGRAGRTAPGVCYRLWTETMHRSLAEHTPPEILRADLSAALLTLAAWGERDIDSFPWVTPPTPLAVNRSKELLTQLGATDIDLNLSAEGARMNALPLHPRLARLMLSATKYHCVEEASLAAALLSERDPFDRRGGPAIDTSGSTAIESDLYDRVTLLGRAISSERFDAIHHGGLKAICRIASQLSKMVSCHSENAPSSSSTTEERFSKAMLAAFPDRLARRRSTGANSALMVGGRGVKLVKESTVRTSELFLCVRVDGKGEESLVRMASSVDVEWLDQSLVDSRVEVFFHPTMKAVVARKRRYFWGLLLDEIPAECEPTSETQRILIEHASADLERLLPAKDQSLQSFIGRWRFLQDRMDRAELPSTIEDALESVLEQFAATRTSFKELSKAPWLDYLKAEFGYGRMAWFEQQAPESIRVPSGNQVRLKYAAGKPPILSVRIQEIFGWRETPRLAGGRVALQLHLLAPNRRPQQITDDLESFWATTYGEVRKELKRRYSKHHWPDDPLTAQATANGLKPRD